MANETEPTFEIPTLVGPSGSLITCNLDPKTCGHFKIKGNNQTGGLCDHPKAPEPTLPHRGFRTCKTKPKEETSTAEN